MTLREWIAGAAGEKLLVTDSARNAERLIRRINREGTTVSLVTVTEPEQLAKELFLRRCAEEGRYVCLRRADREACAGLLEGILRASPEEYSFVPEESLCRATADEILSNLDLIRENVTTEAFAASPDPKAEQLRRLVRAYEAELESRGLTDGPALLAAGLDAARAGRRGADGGIPAAVLLWEEPSALARAFLNAALPDAAVLEEDGEEPARIWRFFSSYGIWNEPEYVLEDVLRRGIAFGDVRIVYSSAEYETPLAAAFGERGVPLRFAGGRPAAGMAPAHMMLSLLDWAEQDYLYEKLRAVVLDPAFRWPEDAEAERTPAEEFLRCAGDGIGWGLERYGAFAGRKGGRCSAAFGAFLCDAAGVFRGISGPVRPGDLFSRMLAFTEKYTDGASRPEGLARLLRRAREDLEFAAPAADLSEAAGLVRDVLGRLKLEEPEDTGAAVAGMLTDTEVLDRPYLYVIGLADRHCAPLTTESPVLNDAERHRYFDREAGRVPLACDRPAERMETYRRSLRASEAREIHAGYCSFDTVRQEPLSPSSLFLDLREEYGDGAEEIPAADYPRVLRQAVVVRTRDLWGSVPAEEAGGISGEGSPAAGELKFSPSSLDTLLDCPARYHFRYIRGIPEEEYDIPDEKAWLKANERGTFFHRIAETYVRERFIGGEPVSPELDGETFERIFLSAAEETEKSVPVAYPAAARRELEEIRTAAEAFLSELHREFGDPDCPWRVLACERRFGSDGQEPFGETYRFDLYEAVDPDGGEVRMAVREGYDWTEEEPEPLEPEEGKEDPEEWEDLESPEEPEPPVFLRTDEFRVAYNGVIDRVDVRTGADGKKHFRLVDYKTGRWENMKKKSGITTQHHIYAAYMSRFGEVDEFVYCFPFEEQEDRRRIVLTEFMDPFTLKPLRDAEGETACGEAGNGEETADGDAGMGRAHLLDDFFVESRFFPHRADRTCRYCPYADICGNRFGRGR